MGYIIAGTVVLDPAGDRTTTGKATLPTTTGTVGTTSFNISGEAGYTYSIGLPSSPTTLLANAWVDTNNILFVWRFFKAAP